MPRRSPQADRSHEALGLAIRHERLRQELTQEEFASRVGLHPTQISSIERGHRNLTFTALQGISRALGLPLSELLAQIEEIEKKELGS